MKPWCGHFHLTLAAGDWSARVMTRLSNCGTSEAVQIFVYAFTNAYLMTCFIGKLIREFKNTHTSHIFDVKFDVARIVRFISLTCFMPSSL
jgi:hypothetical protein